MKVNLYIFRSIFCLLICVFLICSCTKRSSRVSEIEKCINKKVDLNMFDSLLFDNRSIPIAELKHKYKYLSIVYLREGCRPCYLKYVKWHLKMDSIGISENHSVLFVIQAKAYERFFSQIKKNGDIKGKFYTVLDKRFKYITSNDFMSNWIIDQSILIDSENRIKMVGAPYETPQLTKLYRKICSQ